MAKIYLSAAAHSTDNPTKCPVKCGENVHCIRYMDLVEIKLKEQGITVRRGGRQLVGNEAISFRVKDANTWGADIYYVAHTNAGGGRYSMTMCWNNAKSKALAKVFTKYRKSVTPHKVVTRTDLREIKETKMPCLYDELFFHDNAEDCAKFHNGGMEKMAVETVKALCECVGVKYKEPTTATTTKKKTNTDIALEVINGKWGNGATRKKKLTAAGYDYKVIQSIVNDLLA